ncbi:MAG: hypothetical protein ACXWHG_15925, partial [Thermoanaerobaculia bacterium]
YRCSVFHGNLLLVQSEEMSNGRLDEGWNLVTDGNVETVVVPESTHTNLLDQRGAAVARITSERLRRLDTTPATAV